jgi:hypothetical protein
MLYEEFHPQRTIMLKLFLKVSPDDPAVQVGIKGMIEFVIRFATFVADLLTGFMKAAVGAAVVGPQWPLFTL